MKESVGYETILGTYIDPAVDDSLSDKVAERRQEIAFGRSLIRVIEQLERNGVKGAEGAVEDPQDTVAVAIGGNGWRVTAGIPLGTVEGSAK